MLAEGDDLGIEFRIEPVGLLDGGPHIIWDKFQGHAAKMTERVL